MAQLSPGSLAAVIRDLVTSGLWQSNQNMGYDRTLQDLVLGLDYIQDLQDDHAFAMMQALAEVGYTVAPVLGNVHRAGHINSGQVATLFNLAIDNGEPIDVGNLAICPAADELQAGFVLEVGWFSLQLSNCDDVKPSLLLCQSVRGVHARHVLFKTVQANISHSLWMPVCLGRAWRHHLSACTALQGRLLTRSRC
jgi:hypothetical protein